MNIIKRVIFAVAFSFAALVIPGMICLATIDANNDFPYFIIVYGFIMFTMLTYIVISVHSMTKEFQNAIEEMKIQNAAIAYKLTGGDFSEENNNEKTSEQESKKSKKNKKSSVNAKAEDKPDTEKVNLNPAEPLVFNEKKTDDSFDDFK